MKRLLEDARKIIRINSVSSTGTEEVANFALGLMRDVGMKTQLQHVTHAIDDISKRQFNVLGILGDPLVDKKIRKGLLLNTHLDTVSPGLNENWTETAGNPFCLTQKDGKVFGLGTADVKLDFLCKLRAIEKVREKKLKMPIYLVGTCGEELGMFGAKYLIKSMALNPKFVLVGEPSDLKVVFAHKCLNLFRVSIGYQLVERDVRGFNRRVDLSVFGKSSHSSYPSMGQNAILEATTFLSRAIDSGFELRFTNISGGDTVNKVPDQANFQFYLSSHQFEDFKRFFREYMKTEGKERVFRAELGGVGDMGVRFLPESLFPCVMDIVKVFQVIREDFEKVRDDSYNPPHSTLNFGLLRQSSGGIALHFDLRLLPDLIPAEIESHILKEIKAVAARYPNMNLLAVRERTNPGLNMTPEHELMQICKEAMKAADIEPAFDKKATSTEAAQYFAAGYESVVFGPGKSQGNSHSPNEYNLIEHLEKAIRFYTRLIERTCL